MEVVTDRPGMFAEQLRSGSMVHGQRVVLMAPSIDSTGRRSVTITLANGARERHYIGCRVPGTLPRTDLPAGPVRAGRGVRSTRTGWRNGESGRDRHARLIDGLLYR